MRIRTLALVLALLLIAAACSSDSDSADVAATDAPASEPAPEPAAEPSDEEMDDEEMDDEEVADEEMDDEEMADEEMDDEEMADEPDPGPTLTLDFQALPELGDAAVYEGWLIVDGVPVSTGVLSDGPVAVPEGAEAATAFVLTIEPADDPDPAPADTHLLAGDFVDGRAELSAGHPAAIGTDFADATGRYILATPTDGTGAPENERSGVWWTEVPRAQSLFVPALPAGWTYEGWVVIDGMPVTSGTFTDPFAADDAAPFSGPEAGPPLVGEDYLLNAPEGFTFPRDLRGQTVVVSVEPVPDDSPAPFAIKPLVGDVPADAVDHTAYGQANVAAETLPTGEAVLG